MFKNLWEGKGLNQAYSGSVSQTRVSFHHASVMESSHLKVLNKSNLLMPAEIFVSLTCQGLNF